MPDTMYNPQIVEPKWQQFWEEQRLFQQSHLQKGVTNENKEYLLFAFAYPSGSGLHVGHVESKTALDIVARYYRMKGKKVFFPVGWDAFGLPAENYAIKTGVHPAETTKNAINTFRRQIKRLGISYDWENEVATSHPEYYRWTQWIFLQLFKKNLAYRKSGVVNWCPSCQTVLANEQVVEGACERCGTQVVQKELEQWFFKITQYTDELITGLEQVDWPSATKQHQINWIGRKEGISIQYDVVDKDKKLLKEQITCFTTRPDTNFGATFVVIAPEHQFAQSIASGVFGSDKQLQKTVEQYLKQAKNKSELERQQEGKKKTGVFTGFYALNHLTGYPMPIWISDFVLAGFGTGAVVGVPGHDLRDFEFAQFVNTTHPDLAIEIKRVVVGPDGDKTTIVRKEQVQEEDGVMINSDFLDGLPIHDATIKISQHMIERGWASRVVNYKLRDWLISRQRYWGAPIPIVYDPEGNPHPVKEQHLPWLLPTDVEFKPTGESPLRYSKEFHERTERLYGKGWKPEYDTMDTFVDSSWYFLRYIGSRYQEAFTDLKLVRSWLPVDLYMIGPEHIVLHLLYARFFTKFLRDEGYLHFDEPFMKMRHQGMILGPDGRKMSKSKGNVINPDDIIEKFGADTLRVYEMFMGPLEADKAWDPRALIGVHKFLQRIFKLVTGTMSAPLHEEGRGQKQQDKKADALDDSKNITLRKLHQTIKKVSQDIPLLKFNTAIASLMEFSNTWEETKEDRPMGSQDTLSFVRLIAPFAPFLAEELYQTYWPAGTVHLAMWPEWNEALTQADQISIGVQVNGKLRDELKMEYSIVNDKDVVLARAKDLGKIKVALNQRTLIKEIYIPGKIINFVIK